MKMIFISKYVVLLKRFNPAKLYHITNNLLVLVSFSLILNLTSSWVLLVWCLVWSLTQAASSLTRADVLKDMSVVPTNVTCWCFHSDGVFTLAIITFFFVYL